MEMNDIAAENEKLRQENLAQSARIAALEAQLNSSESTLQQLMETRSEFISRISHDLKTPLTGIKLFADILLSQAEDVDDKSQEKYLAIISAEVQRMSRMISCIADLHNFDAGRMEWHEEETDLVELIDRCVRPVEKLCQAKGIGFSYTADVKVLITLIDAPRFARLVSSLLGNALRFTETGTVTVELQSDAGKFSLAVSDNGPGFAEERLHELLQPVAVDTAPNENIALRFARCVVEHYRGSIQAGSVIGKGSVFSVELPLRRKS